jgi:hypothetical protein
MTVELAKLARSAGCPRLSALLVLALTELEITPARGPCYAIGGDTASVTPRGGAGAASASSLLLDF